MDSKLAVALCTSSVTLIPLALVLFSTGSCNWRSLDAGPILVAGTPATALVRGITTTAWSTPRGLSRLHPAPAGQALWLSPTHHKVGQRTSGHRGTVRPTA